MNTSKIWTDYQRLELERAVKSHTKTNSYYGHRKISVNWDRVARVQWLFTQIYRTGSACHVEYNKIHKGEK